MQITTNFLVAFLINLYKYKNAHQDFISLNNKKLNILLKHLNIENCINFDSKGLSFSQNKGYLNKSNFKDIKELSHFDIKMILDFINLSINSSLENICREKSIRPSGMLTSTSSLENYFQITNAWKNDMILNSHETAMNLIYKENIESNLNILFGMDFRKIKNEKDFDKLNHWKINCKIEDKDDLKIMNTQLDHFDYL